MIKAFRYIRENVHDIFENKLIDAVKEADKQGLEVEIQYQTTAVTNSIVYSSIVIGRECTVNAERKSNDCICKKPTRRLLNTHMDKRNIDLNILGKGEDKGIVIFEHGLAIATFDINYCPVCGEPLAEGEG